MVYGIAFTSLPMLITYYLTSQFPVILFFLAWLHVHAVVCNDYLKAVFE